MQTMSPPHSASSDRRNIVRIKIKKAEKKTDLKEAGAVLRNTKEELHESICYSSQVAGIAPAESPTRILELMTADPLSGKSMHSSLKSRISNSVPPSNQMGKMLPKRPSEGIIASGRYQKRRKLINDSFREIGTDFDGNKTVKEETISSMSGCSGSHQTLTSTCSSCFPDRQEKGKISSTDARKANESEESLSLMNEARDFKHRADRLKREGETVLSNILYLGAVLKFLRLAFLSEHGPGENNEAAMHLHSDTAKLAQYCASECENKNNMPAAALAYKAMELAHMKAAALAYNMPAAASTNEAVFLSDSMTSAFEGTRRYQILMQSEELAAPIMACLNFHSNNTNMFIQMAPSALESIF